MSYMPASTFPAWFEILMATWLTAATATVALLGVAGPMALAAGSADEGTASTTTRTQMVVPNDGGTVDREEAE